MTNGQLLAINTHVAHTRDTHTHTTHSYIATPMHTGRAPKCAMKDARRVLCTALDHGGVIKSRKKRAPCLLEFH